MDTIGIEVDSARKIWALEIITSDVKAVRYFKALLTNLSTFEVQAI
jgi:hypothetical protein